MDSSSMSGGDVLEKEEKSECGATILVDPFLVEALHNQRHRLTVLRMELDIQRFVQNPDQHQFEFLHFPTSYLRCAAHRVAQYYGLQTMALDTVDGLGSRIIVMKTPECRFPSVCLSDIPIKQPENEINGQVKIAIRQRPNASLSDGLGSEAKRSSIRTVEERKEEYDKARARIFSGSANVEVEGASSLPITDGRSLYEQEYCRSVLEEIEKTGMRDGASRVAIFRDREKDRHDPDYDRSYDRYARGLTPSQSFSIGTCNVIQPPFLQYEAGFAQVMRTPSSMSFRPINPALSPFCAFGSNQASQDPVYMQWPSPAMMYAHSYDHLRHAVYQAPFYQQALSFEHSQKR